MSTFRRLVFVLVFALLWSARAADYFPPRGSWEHRAPGELGFDAAKLQQAIAFSVANENPSLKDVAFELQQTFGAREPNFKLLGPTQPRAALSGIVIHH